jgi:hypothetical protein
MQFQQYRSLSEDSYILRAISAWNMYDQTRCITMSCNDIIRLPVQCQYFF